jgi:hypothetical protein
LQVVVQVLGVTQVAAVQADTVKIICVWQFLQITRSRLVRVPLELRLVFNNKKQADQTQFLQQLHQLVAVAQELFQIQTLAALQAVRAAARAVQTVAAIQVEQAIHQAHLHHKETTAATVA